MTRIQVADAAMVSEANRKAIEAAGLSFILGAKIPDVPHDAAADGYLGRAAVAQNHPHRQIPDGHVFTQPWPAGPNDARRDCQLSESSTTKAVAGKAPVKRNRFITVTGGTKKVNRPLEAKARALAGIKGYLTNIDNPNAEFVTGA